MRKHAQGVGVLMQVDLRGLGLSCYAVQFCSTAARLGKADKISKARHGRTGSA